MREAVGPGRRKGAVVKSDYEALGDEISAASRDRDIGRALWRTPIPETQQQRRHPHKAGLQQDAPFVSLGPAS